MLLLLLNYSYGQEISNLEKAQITFKKGDYNKAISLYTEIINSQDPEEKYVAHYGRAYCYYELKIYDNAEVDIVNALRIKKKNKDYNFIKGSSYWLYYLTERKHGITSKSLKFLRKATKYNQSSLLFSTKGYAECFLGKYKASLKSLKKAIQLDNNNAWAYNNRALVNLKLNNLDLARADVNKSIQIDDKNPYAYKNSALIYISLEDFDSACHEINIAEGLGLSKRMTGNDLEELNKLRQKFCETQVDKK